MLGSLNSSNTLFYDLNPNNLKKFHENSINFETTEYNIINIYIIHKFNLYITINKKTLIFRIIFKSVSKNLKPDILTNLTTLSRNL